MEELVARLSLVIFYSQTLNQNFHPFLILGVFFLTNSVFSGLFFGMFIVATHSSENGKFGRSHCQKQGVFETHERSKICQQTCCSSSRLSDFQNSYSFELRDSGFGSLPSSNSEGL